MQPNWIRIKLHYSLFNMKLFVTAFIQVFLVAFNTWLIANEVYEAVFVVGFLISFVWTFNVKKVTIGTMKDRIIYSLGAAFGSLSGLVVGVFII